MIYTTIQPTRRRIQPIQPIQPTQPPKNSPDYVNDRIGGHTETHPGSQHHTKVTFKAGALLSPSSRSSFPPLSTPLDPPRALNFRIRKPTRAKALSSWAIDSTPNSPANSRLTGIHFISKCWIRACGRWSTVRNLTRNVFQRTSGCPHRRYTI